MEESWTILQLAELAADALAAGQRAGSSSEAGPPSTDGRSGDGGASGAGGRSGDGGASGAGGRSGDGGASGAGGRSGDGGVSGAGGRSGDGGVSGAEGPSSGAARAVPVRANGRVRDVPNERLVRWYVTVGLVDPPLSRRGRVAQYGRRHLLQLVAVKRRQAEGRSLAEIQAELAGATDDVLAAVARVPDSRRSAGVRRAAPARFWTRSGVERELDREEEGLADTDTHTDTDQDGGRGRLVHGVRLAAGVTLLLEGAAREPGPDDVDAILNAARALLAELAGRGLHEPGPEHPADAPGQDHLE